MHVPLRTSLALAAAALGLGGCFDPGTMIVSGVAQAAVMTAIEESAKNRPTPEQMWHRTQVSSLERRAQAGDLEAQFQVATYYLRIREPAAGQWICEAASRGHAKAQLQYGHLLNEDRLREDLFPFVEVTPDNAAAYLWYSLAARNGEPRAPHFRDSVRENGGLSAPRVQAAERRLASWAPGPCDGLPTASAAWNGAAATAGAAAGWRTPLR